MTNNSPDRHAPYHQQAVQRFGSSGSAGYEYPSQFGDGFSRGPRSSPGFDVSRSNGGPEHQKITLLPGEDTVFAAEFTASPILRHIKSGLVVTQKRVIVRHPQQLLWLIKVGHNESACPIEKLSQVTVGRTFSKDRLIKGALFCFVGAFLLFSGLPSLVMAAPIMGFVTLLLGLPALAVGALFFWMARHLGLTVVHYGGSSLHIDVDKSEYQDMVTAGQLIQRLMLGIEPSTQSTNDSSRSAPTPRESTPASQARTEIITRNQPAPPPAAPPADPALPPTIWRG